MRSPENYEKTEIRRFLDNLGHDCWHFSPFMGGYGKSGVSDIIGVYRGRFFCIEVKREGKKPTPIQERRMKEVTHAHGCAFAGTASTVIPAFKAVFGV